MKVFLKKIKDSKSQNLFKVRQKVKIGLNLLDHNKASESNINNFFFSRQVEFLESQNLLEMGQKA